uniref:Uncharacterized protein n=1 Tax=Zea mays TaxID=4577 RepID=B6U0F9_MAIZE|nr:hypothetical protein [Zea mays]
MHARIPIPLLARATLSPVPRARACQTSSGRRRDEGGGRRRGAYWSRMGTGGGGGGAEECPVDGLSSGIAPGSFPS